MHPLLSLLRQISHPDAIFVYQMGKVGSTSIVAALPNSVHLHTLYGYAAASAALDFKRQTLLGRLQRLAFWLVVRARLRLRREIRIITITRNPYDREVSQFFQDLEHWLSYRTLRIGSDPYQQYRDTIVDCFENYYDFQFGRNWYARELGKFTGLRLADVAFDKERGFGTAQVRNCRILFVRLDRMDGLENELSRFADREISLGHYNGTTGKWYAALHDEFRKSYTPSESVLQRVFDDNWVECFYESRELERMRDAARRPSA